MEDRWDWLGTVFLTLVIGIGLGYAYRYVQEPSAYERGYIEGMEELSVVARGEICK